MKSPHPSFHLKMTPEHHRAVAEIWERSDVIETMERRLRWLIAEGAGWRPQGFMDCRCVFCSGTPDGQIGTITLCAPCLREHAGARWAVIAMLRMPAVGEHRR